MSELSADELAEAREIADIVQLNDDTVLGVVQEAVRTAYLEVESEDHGGAFVTLDATAVALWNEGVRIAFNRWRATSPEATTGGGE